MSQPSPSTLLQQVRDALSEAADPARAPQMQAYMKSAMPYHGVRAPEVRALCKRLFAPLRFAEAGEWEAAVRGLWDAAEFREERYAALHLAGHRSASSFQTLAALPLYEHLVVTGAWWDMVDTVAPHGLGELLRRYPEEMTREMLAWSRSDDLWKRRSAIICQLGFKEKTDMALLYACIEGAWDSPEFFLRKAIGWALREVAWRDPEEVVRYVRANHDRLSPLSRREALKNVLKSGAHSALGQHRL